MKVDEKILKRFEDLVSKGEGVIQSRDVDYPEYINSSMSVSWLTSSLDFIARVFGIDSEYYNSIKNNTYNKFPRDYSSRSSIHQAVEVLKAAKDDYENGYLFNTRVLIEAEVFDDFLEQAEHLLKQGYYQAAAVIAGSALEDCLRKLCVQKSVTLPPKATINPMNDGLAKAGVYNTLIQKKITALADIRNKAAHGQWTEFNGKDVEDMIRNIRRFMEEYFN